MGLQRKICLPDTQFLQNEYLRASFFPIDPYSAFYALFAANFVSHNSVFLYRPKTQNPRSPWQGIRNATRSYFSTMRSCRRAQRYISEESTLAKYRRLLTVCLFLYPAGATVLHKKAYYLLIYEKIIDNLKNKVIKYLLSA